MVQVARWTPVFGLLALALALDVAPNENVVDHQEEQRNKSTESQNQAKDAISVLPRYAWRLSPSKKDSSNQTQPQHGGETTSSPQTQTNTILKNYSSKAPSTSHEGDDLAPPLKHPRSQSLSTFMEYVIFAILALAILCICCRRR